MTHKHLKRILRAAYFSGMQHTKLAKNKRLFLFRPKNLCQSWPQDNEARKTVSLHRQKTFCAMETEKQPVNYHHTLPVQLRFNDVDRFGHVNNVVYFSFYDMGKCDYFISVCPGVSFDEIGIVAVHVEADFMNQIYATDHIAVQTAITEIGCKSFHLSQRVIDVDTKQVKCEGHSVMVTFDLSTHQPMPLKPEWIEAICAFEGKDVRRKKKG